MTKTTLHTSPPCNHRHHLALDGTVGYSRLLSTCVLVLLALLFPSTRCEEPAVATSSASAAGSSDRIDTQVLEVPVDAANPTKTSKDPTVVGATAVFEFDKGVFLGSGCTANSVQIHVEQQSKTKALVHVEFSDVKPFQASLQVGAQVSQRQRQTCNGALPVQIQEGYQLGVNSQLIKGRIKMPAKDKTQAFGDLKSEFFFTPSSKSSGRIAKQFAAQESEPTDQDFGLDPDPSQQIWTSCHDAQSTILRINTALTVQQQPHVQEPSQEHQQHTKDQMLLQLDTTDGMVFSVEARSCQ